MVNTELAQNGANNIKLYETNIRGYIKLMKYWSPVPQENIVKQLEKYVTNHLKRIYDEKWHTKLRTERKMRTYDYITWRLPSIERTESETDYNQFKS